MNNKPIRTVEDYEKAVSNWNEAHLCACGSEDPEEVKKANQFIEDIEALIEEAEPYFIIDDINETVTLKE